MKPITEDNIFKDCIVAIVVTETPLNDGNFVDMRYLTDDTDDGTYLEDGERIVGVLSAPSMAFEVYGVDDNGKMYRLGTEFEGASNPNWVNEFKRMMKNMTTLKYHKDL